MLVNDIILFKNTIKHLESSRQLLGTNELSPCYPCGICILLSKHNKLISIILGLTQL